MPSKRLTVPKANIDAMIRAIRGQRVMLDSDLARVYGVPTFRFNEAVKRNRNRFPSDFMFQLTAEEYQSLVGNSSQIAMSSAKHRGKRYRPYVFTEHGALQAANILKSARAVQMSVFVIRAFLKMRGTLLGTRELAEKLEALEKQLKGRLDTHEVAIVGVLQQIMKILNPPPGPASPPKPRIGFSP
jgi:hypothetical protein